MSFTLGPWRLIPEYISQPLGSEPSFVEPTVWDDDENNPKQIAVIRCGLEGSAANGRLIAASPELYVRLGDLIDIIEKAGLLNLSNGVQLGATVWYVKASERLGLAKAAILKAEGKEQSR